MTSNELTVFNPRAALEMALAMKQAVASIQKDVLKEDVDYGKVPGVAKPSLFKPGAERLCSAFKLWPKFNIVSQLEDWSSGLFFYRYECVLMHRETGEVYGSGIGSCNSNENKYGWRWVTEDRIPPNLRKDTLVQRGGLVSELDFAIEKAETTGQWGKPAEYWQRFKDAIANGTATRTTRKTKNGDKPAWAIDGIEYRIPNTDVFDVVNTIDKMAQKRALVAAVLVATNASEFFTQDMEDFALDTGNVIEGRAETVTPKTAPAPRQQSEPQTPAPQAPASTAQPHWSDDPKMVNACYKWAADTFGFKQKMVDAALSGNGVSLLNLTRDEFKGLILATASLNDAEAIAKTGEAKGLSAEVITAAMSFVAIPD